MATALSHPVSITAKRKLENSLSRKRVVFTSSRDPQGNNGFTEEGKRNGKAFVNKVKLTRKYPKGHAVVKHRGWWALWILGRETMLHSFSPSYLLEATSCIILNHFFFWNESRYMK